MRTVYGVFGVILALVGACFFATSLAMLVTGDHRGNVAGGVGVVVLSTGLAWAGIYLARRMLRGTRRQPPVSADTSEKRVLAYVVKHGGRTTVPEAAARCSLTLAESREVLDRLASQGVAEILVAGDGTMVYAVAGLLTDEAKAAAVDPIAS